jgi:hypothetical protein
MLPLFFDVAVVFDVAVSFLPLPLYRIIFLACKVTLSCAFMQII